MLRRQLAAVHFGPQSDYSMVPEPLDTTYMDWSLPPFNAGYHAYAGHYSVGDVQQKIRKPSQLIVTTPPPSRPRNYFSIFSAASTGSPALRFAARFFAPYSALRRATPRRR